MLGWHHHFRPGEDYLLEQQLYCDALGLNAYVSNNSSTVPCQIVSRGAELKELGSDPWHHT